MSVIKIIFQPLILMHIACLGIFFTNFSWLVFTIFLVSLIVRMFGVTAGFHRYFSHRSYKTSRYFQFILAVLGTAAAQRGPLWWASHHRQHHKESDKKKGYSLSCTKWILACSLFLVTRRKVCKCSIKKSERFFKIQRNCMVDKYHYIIVFIYSSFIFAIGFLLETYFPLWE